MTYGDGSGTYFDILTSIDVAAHEVMLFVQTQQIWLPTWRHGMRRFLIFGAVLNIMQRQINLPG
jgi:hypothetical protein